MKDGILKSGPHGRFYPWDRPAISGLYPDPVNGQKPQKSAGRAKDFDDVQGVIAVQANRIDWEYVNQWCDLHGTWSLLDEIRASIPPI